MAIPKSASIRPLRLAENHFLEVLLSKFELRREGKGAHLEVSFDSQTPACWNRASREKLRDYLFKSPKKVKDYQKKLDDVLVRECRDEFVPKDPNFVFRWASAGALPIIRLGSEEYYCFFYREIRPIGWNIANGACDTSAELLDPLRTLERELCEELIILDPKKSVWNVLERGDPSSMDRPEYNSVQLIVKGLKKKGLWDKSKDVNQQGTALKWFNGPDSATIHTRDKDHKEVSHEVDACYLNINAEDFGIELDRVVIINVSENALIFDGEIMNGKLLNRLVGLFRTDRFNDEAEFIKKEFIPDKCFYRGRELDAVAFNRLMGISLRDARQGESSGTAKSKICQFLNDITSENTRSPKEIRKYKNKKIKFDFCPVTRRLLHRFARAAGPIPKEQAGKGKGKGTKSYDVFVSFGHGDEKLAAKVARHIKKHCGKKVFYYPISQTDHDFYRAIDRALESAQCLVAVGSSLEHLTARWPEYEYRTFNLEMLGPRKPNGKLLSLVVGIDPNNLPLPLRSFIVTSCQNEAGLPKALEKLLKYLPKKGSKKISMKGSKKVSGDSSAVNNPTSLV